MSTNTAVDRMRIAFEAWRPGRDLRRSGDGYLSIQTDHEWCAYRAGQNDALTAAMEECKRVDLAADAKGKSLPLVNAYHILGSMLHG